MTTIEEKIYKCFEILDSNFFNDFETNINKRILFQKIGLLFAYFFGLRIGDFSLYIHGPYNSELTDIGYKFARQTQYYNKCTASINFADKAIDIINAIKNNIFNQDINFIEVYITYFYLLNKRKFDSDKAEEKLIEIKHDLMTKPSVREYMDNILEVHEQFKKEIHRIAPNLEFI